MKWYNVHSTKILQTLKARKNGYVINVIYTFQKKGWGVRVSKRDFLWISLDSNLWWETTEDAQRWCESQDFSKLQKDYEMAKREEAKCQL